MQLDEKKEVKYAEPISVLRMTDIDQFETSLPAHKKKFNVIKHITLKN